MIELYGGRCLRCGVDRPLEVAHLAPWPVVRDDAMRQPGQNQEGMAILRFHQPANLVLLCANCHTLLDDPAVAEVDPGLMFCLRDRATATEHFGEVTRAFVCKEMTGNRRRPSVSDAAQRELTTNPLSESSGQITPAKTPHQNQAGKFKRQAISHGTLVNVSVDEFPSSKHWVDYRRGRDKCQYRGTASTSNPTGYDVGLRIRG